MSGDVSLAIRYQPIAQSILERKKICPPRLSTCLPCLRWQKASVTNTATIGMRQMLIKVIALRRL